MEGKIVYLVVTNSAFLKQGGGPTWREHGGGDMDDHWKIWSQAMLTYVEKIKFFDAFLLTVDSLYFKPFY